ncbi:MAG: signal peptidase II [Pseudobutyrivibrio sp.]|nr:signal peptidase II [Clostridia bacterium]MCF0130149.1 signal peptidase II [Pseudobutyrivibrio sp.]
MFKTRKKSIIIGVLLIIGLIILDQFTKKLAINLKNTEDIILVNNVLQLHYLENNGAAFSILQGKQIFFKILTPIALAIMSYIYINLSKVDKFNDIKLILVFVFAGAVGNYIDRIRFEYVIDFIYFSLIDFPVFNIADCYVTCCMFLLIILILFKYKEDDFDDMMKLIRPGKKHE